MALLVLAKNGATFSTHAALLTTIAVTTACWLVTAYLGPQTDREVLIRFYTSSVRSGRGGPTFDAQAGLPADGRVSPDNIPMALLGWVVGCAAIWSGLFAIGNFLYGETGRCLLCSAVFVVSGLVLLQIVRNLWSDSREAAIAERSV